MRLVITKPDGTRTVRTFADRAQAAEFGVGCYLFDVHHAPRTLADMAAADFAATGSAVTGGFLFTEQAE